MNEGDYRICDSDHHCRIVSELSVADKAFRLQEQGYRDSFPRIFESIDRSSTC
ncbi:hypothetical protein SynMEDNS5_01364 [Synechococcus sp. MEDNS5]|nr:hypothetical protein SynMEDNS5_01364 [Synechococcus sp. MEDNS5]